jgi:hypothetical protein
MEKAPKRRWKGWIAAILVLALVVAGWEVYRLYVMDLDGASGEAAPGQAAVVFDFEKPPGTDGLPDPWQAKVSKGRLRAEARNVDGQAGKVLWIRSESASFLVGNRAQSFDPREYPILRWSWRAVILPTNGDVRKNSLLFGENRNDQAVQILVVFEGNRILSYVWDTTAPVGTEVEEPSLVGTVRTHVIESGASRLNAWLENSVDLEADFRRRFGEAPPRVIAVAVQSNANHTASVGEGFVGRIIASKRQPGG